jgi:hypothetical protein
VSARRKNPVFVGAMTLCAALALGEGFLIWERWSAARAAAAKLDEHLAARAEMANLMPPPKRDVAEAIEADLAKAQAALAAMQAELKGRGPVAERLRAAKVPAARTDAFFDLAAYVERMREAARRHRVIVRSEAARFGFAAYANEAPEPERIAAVFRQRQLAQYLLEALLAAEPRALLAVNREPTLTDEERAARAAALAELQAALAAAEANGEPPPDPDQFGATGAPSELPEGPDYFAIDPRVTARVPGYVDTTAFRLVFVGQTAALRAWLNRLAAFELPVLVREIEVDLATAEELADVPAEESAPEAAAPEPAAAEPSVVLTLDSPAPSPRPAPARPAAAPIVSKPYSKFTVTVELVELVPPPAPPAEETAAPPPAT